VPCAEPSDLASFPLFGSLSDSELAEVAVWFEVREVEASVRLAGEGATGHSFFVLCDGEVAVTAQGEEIATLGPGEFFGELALLGSVRRTATVTTTAPCRLLVLFGPDFARFRAAYPGVAAELEAAMQRRLSGHAG
jgi:CRP-like cAMP-binding protein